MTNNYLQQKNKLQVISTMISRLYFFDGWGSYWNLPVKLIARSHLTWYIFGKCCKESLEHFSN